MCLFMKVNNFNSLYEKFIITQFAVRKKISVVHSKFHTTRVNNKSQFHAVSYELEPNVNHCPCILWIVADLQSSLLEKGSVFITYISIVSFFFFKHCFNTIEHILITELIGSPHHCGSINCNAFLQNLQ